MKTLDILHRAKAASYIVANLSTEEKNSALKLMAESLLNHMEDILDANKLDIEAARGTLSEVMIDRLALSENRIKDMANGILEVAELEDPCGRILEHTETKTGLHIDKVSVPMGVTAMIYESRPNVTSDAAVLAFKSGNACVLRGGKEAFRSSLAIVEALKEGLKKANICEDIIELVRDTSRESAKELMTANGLVDLLIPRGGAGLIRACVENATVNCIETGTGICHIYIDSDADITKALNIIDNAKTSRPSVCNAAEVCLVHKDIAKEFLPLMKECLVNLRIEKGLIPVELRLDKEAAQIIDGKAAVDTDFDTEFLDYILAVKVVDNIDEAISHIRAHSTGHSEAIITENSTNSKKFTANIDSAAVYINTSTRFTDGGVFGLGCEIGISTQKLHARGPMGLRELNTYKYIIKSDGCTR